MEYYYANLRIVIGKFYWLYHVDGNFNIFRIGMMFFEMLIILHINRMPVIREKQCTSASMRPGGL